MKTLNLKIETEGLNIPKKIGSASEGMGAKAIEFETDGVKLMIQTIKNVVIQFTGLKKNFGEDNRRTYYKICDKFDDIEKARKNGEDIQTVELEDAEMGIIRKVFKENPDLPPTDLLMRVERNIWAVENR